MSSIRRASPCRREASPSAMRVHISAFERAPGQPPRARALGWDRVLFGVRIGTRAGVYSRMAHKLEICVSPDGRLGVVTFYNSLLWCLTRRTMLNAQFRLPLLSR
jgi:hypothetical protein